MDMVRPSWARDLVLKDDASEGRGPNWNEGLLR